MSEPDNGAKALAERLHETSHQTFDCRLTSGERVCEIMADAILATGAVFLTAEEAGLDAAWAEAEAALPEGWTLLVGKETGALYWATGSGPRDPITRSYKIVSTSQDGRLHDSPAAALLALRAALDPHEHRWVDARNEIVESGEMCPDCGAVRPSDSHD